MTERTAIIFLFTVLCTVLLIACFVLKATGAGNHAIVVAYLTVLSVGGLSTGWLVSRYADKKTSQRDRR